MSGADDDRLERLRLVAQQAINDLTAEAWTQQSEHAFALDALRAAKAPASTRLLAEGRHTLLEALPETEKRSRARGLRFRALIKKLETT